MRKSESPGILFGGWTGASIAVSSKAGFTIGLQATEKKVINNGVKCGLAIIPVTYGCDDHTNVTSAGTVETASSLIAVE